MAKFDFNKLPAPTRNMARMLCKVQKYHVVRSDIPRCVALRRGGETIYIVGLNRKGEPGPFAGVAFMRKAKND